MNDTSGNGRQEVQGLGESHRQEVKREIREFVKLIVWFLVLFVALRQFVIEGYEVQGPSMKPTLQDRERILVLKLPHLLSQYSMFSFITAVEPGDIVVFDSPDEPHKRYVKRVVAEGRKRTRRKAVTAESKEDSSGHPDAVKVAIKDGVLYVDNKRVEEDDLPVEPLFPRDVDKETLLDPGEYYVLGDNLEVSKDSRIFGSIGDRQVIGKAVLRFWPLSRFSLLK